MPGPQPAVRPFIFRIVGSGLDVGGVGDAAPYSGDP